MWRGMRVGGWMEERSWSEVDAAVSGRVKVMDGKIDGKGEFEWSGW